VYGGYIDRDVREGRDGVRAEIAATTMPAGGGEGGEGRIKVEYSLYAEGS